MRTVAALIVTVLALWQGIIWLAQMPPFLLPSPVAVADALWINRAEIARHAGFTLAEVVLGFALGAALGAALAVAMGFSQRLAGVLRPILTFSQTIPVFALAPILTLWLGFGMAPKIAVTVLIVFFPVASAFLDGLMRTPQAALDLAQVMGASRLRIMRHLRVPAALPSLATGLRLAAVYAPIGAVIGEWVGGARGLGALMIHANGRMKTDLVFAALLVLSVMTVIFAKAVALALHRLWRRYGA
ncbi:putative hydroxymethylpyrimidine transport system permease protein [Paracoccus aminovorans]|uniref:Putative hydroxymethylpyrimidine transport system permease protein n=1 Tax=Paracoccus aminovorans TaxID=34004 RepID=A0A1I3BDT3_9RHOB|nr:ABC transporter permease [Paracoccus aminovorans]CQR84769.1 putative ABC transporter permease protein [Paracoccus aminovorans]SFH60236.1 putative hydroxymethylpyrimidine transport system permease protein [Paracoccus aminovorans]